MTLPGPSACAPAAADLPVFRGGASAVVIWSIVEEKSKRVRHVLLAKTTKIKIIYIINLFTGSVCSPATSLLRSMATSFTPTSAELALVNHIFAQADSQRIGILTGDVAVKLFGGSKLSPTVLGEIWSVADEDNNGFLTKKGAAIALRLMGHAQKGDKVNKSLLSKRAFGHSAPRPHVLTQHSRAAPYYRRRTRTSGPTGDWSVHPKVTPTHPWSAAFDSTG